MLKALERRGVVRVSPEVLEVDDALANRDPVLAQLAAAAVAGLPPAGPAERKREPVALATGGALEIVGDLVVQDGGFNLHAKTRAGAVDDEARARLLRFVLRPPLANHRLAILPAPPQQPPPSGKRCRHIKWADLLRLTFALTVDQCPACGGRMNLRALVRDPESIERFLRHQAMGSPPEENAAARAPPYLRAVTRLAPTRQQELFPEI